MDYRYTDEDAVSVTITLTLHELDRLIATSNLSPRTATTWSSGVQTT
jgi:hypothetical protein